MKVASTAAMAGIILFACARPASAQVSAMDFAKHAEIQSVSLSPGGEYVALAVPVDDGNETQLEVVALDGSGKTKRMSFGRRQHVSDVIWSGDTQLVVSRAVMQPLKAMPVSYGELISTDVEAKNQDFLFGFVPDRAGRRGKRKDQGFADVIGVLRDEPNSVLVRYRCWRSVCGDQPPSVVFKVDTLTGQRHEIERVADRANFFFDNTGRARILESFDEADNPKLSYRPGAGNDWIPMPASLAARDIDSVRFEDDGNTAYATVSDRGEPAKLYRLDLAAGTRELLAGRDDAAISYIMYEGRFGKPFGVVYDADKPTINYVDPKSEWSQIHLALLKLFPGEMLFITGSSRDGRKVLAYTTSDRDPGTWYLYDRDAGKLQLVAKAEPWIDAKQMAPVRPITFKSRDGTTLFGFLTAPGTEPGPLVVMPHGGPIGIHDTWSFDAQAQFLASRGYSVLQVNYRGSGGRGELFEHAGWLEWGGKMQDDIADGVRWAIGQELADPERICTFGASFGGYSALMQPIRYPDLYKCAIGYAGVYDLNLMRKTDSFSDTRGDRRFFDRTLGKDRAALDAISPALHVADLQVPVMLVHGGQDKVANIDQFEAMRDALRDAGRDPETLVVAGEGHGFYKPENRAELFEKMAAFLDKHIGPGH